MPSPMFAAHVREDRWTATVSLVGAALWAAFATLAGLRHAPLGIIELLFLFAPLVVVPLGLELGRLLASSHRSPLLRILQVPATFAVIIAFWLPPGRTSALLSIPWFLLCTFLACDRLFQSRRAKRESLSLILLVAHFDLMLGAAWLVISRAGLRPVGFQEPIILLTAVHFHYSGFATAVIASATLRASERNRIRMPGLSALVWLIVLLPFALAAGFVFSPTLRFVAAVALSICVTTLAMVLWWFAGNFASRTARVYLRAASWAAIAAFFLAGTYALSEYFQKGWITVPGMANSHGVLNGLGFVLCSLLGWLTEFRPSEFNGGARPVAAPVQYSNAPVYGADRPPSSTPEFIAHEFYDR